MMAIFTIRVNRAEKMKKRPREAPLAVLSNADPFHAFGKADASPRSPRAAPQRKKTAVITTKIGIRIPHEYAM
jgi:hypothetical protein